MFKVACSVQDEKWASNLRLLTFKFDTLSIRVLAVFRNMSALSEEIVNGIKINRPT